MFPLKTVSLMDRTDTPAQRNVKVETRMRTSWILLFILSSTIASVGLGQSAGTVHTPAKGSVERKAILDALRGDQQVVYKVNFFKVHNGWAWVDVTPLDTKGNAVAEGGPNLLHLENGAWTVLDITKVPEDPNDPLGPEDASPGFIRNLKKTFPGVPGDIFPRPSH